MSEPGEPTSLWESVTRHPGVRKVAENVSWLFVERMLLLAVNLAVSIWFINHLGAEDYGRYSYAVSFAALFAVLASLGLDTIVIRELSVTGRAAGETLGTAFAMRTVASLGTLALICLSILLVSGDPTVQLLVVIVATGVLADPAQVVDLWFQSRIQSKYVVLLRSTISVLGALTRVALILLDASLVAFAALYAAQALAVGAALIVLFLARRPRELVLGRSLQRARELFADAWPLIVAGLSVTVYMRIDRIMLGEMLGDREVGTYSTAATISEVWNVLPVAITGSLFPIIVRSKESGDAGRYAGRMQALYDAMVMMSYAIGIGFTLLGPWLVNLLFTEEYTPAGPILQIHIWSLLFVALGTARTRFLITENLVRFSMMTTLTGSVLNVLANWLLIPRAGGVGAALATLISYSIAAFFSGLVYRPARATTVQMTRALLVPLRLRQFWNGLREIL